MASKKKGPTGSDGANARRRAQSMPSEPTDAGPSSGMEGTGVAEMTAAPGMSGEEEMPGDVDFTSAVAAMTRGVDMPSGEMSDEEYEGGGVAVAAPPEEVSPAEAGPAAPRGIVPPEDFEARGLAPVITAAPSLTNHGGPLLGAVQVVPVYWGSAWSQTANSQLASQLDSFLDFILGSEYMDMLAEYSTATTTIQHGQRLPSVRITNSEPGTIVGTQRQVTDAQIQTSLQGFIANGTLPATNANTLYFVYLPPGVLSLLGSSESCVNYCGYHNHIGGVRYAAIPFVSCTGCTFPGQFLDTLTEVSSHELAEAVTDPDLNAWWDSSTGDEIGDICNRQTTRLGGFLVQTEWSNAQNACVIAPAAPVGAPRPSSSPVVAWAANRLDVFVLGTNRALYHKWWNGSAWGPSLTGYEFMAGICESAPQAVAWGPNRLDVFVTGTDSALYHKWWDGSAWGPSVTAYEGMGGICVGDPRVVSWGPNRLDVFVIGTDRALYHKWWDGSAWGPSLTGYERLGGICTSGPKAVSWGPNRLDVFVTGTDGALYHKWWDGSAWGPSLTGYERMGGVCVGQPEAVAWGPNRLDVFVTGTDSALYHKWWDGSAWGPALTGYEFMGGICTSQPRAVAWGPNRLDVFVTGTDSALYHKWWNGSAWGPSVTGYERQGGVISSF